MTTIATTAAEISAVLGTDGRVEIWCAGSVVAALTVWDALAVASQTLEVARIGATDAAREAQDPVVLVDRLAATLAGAGARVPSEHRDRDIQLSAASMLLRTLGADVDPPAAFQQTQRGLGGPTVVPASGPPPSPNRTKRTDGARRPRRVDEVAS
ncbi:MAG: hypothetical protein QOE61_4722 [Micromonosporaceae bacterium]|nr:hypothetical protein [Micromonosporaceae bacterium]